MRSVTATLDSVSDLVVMGWRCTWRHPATDDSHAGSWWATRSAADECADALRAGLARDVKVVRSVALAEEILNEIAAPAPSTQEGDHA